VFIDFYGAFSSIMKRKEVQYVLWQLTYKLWNKFLNFIKKIPNLVSLIASITSSDSYGVKNYNYCYMRSEESIDSKTVRIGPCMCKLYLFEPTCASLGVTSVLRISK